MLRPIGDDVWAYEAIVRLPAGFALPARATVVRRDDGALVLHSPLPIDDATAAAIAEVGEVRAIVAPSCTHYLHVRAAAERYPRACVWGAPGLEKKLAGVALSPLPTSGAVEGLRVRLVEGVPYLTEHLFLHERSASLLVTDFIFNVNRLDNLPMKIFLWMAGTWKRPAQSKLWRLVVEDRAALARSVSDILAWDFTRVVTAHGDVLEENARAHLQRAAGWMTRGRSRLLGAKAA
ncbi:MAG: DUF4336 domain-containing protein [Labilithrix sp.]|nr:DUF4336 domain-containing protein [Labilithrix sp.]